jgi:hypothetical protein
MNISLNLLDVLRTFEHQCILSSGLSQEYARIHLLISAH